MDVCDRKRVLMVMTSACASAAFGLLCIAVATDYWLYTKEKLDQDINGTAIFNQYWTGLFRKCKVDGKCFYPLEHKHIFEPAHEKMGLMVFSGSSNAIEKYPSLAAVLLLFLKLPRGLYYMSANSTGSGEPALMRRLA